ncbi:MAG: hypothetical protein QXW06_05455, partial [Thermoplasmata archaeon]
LPRIQAPEPWRRFEPPPGAGRWTRAARVTASTARGDGTVVPGSPPLSLTPAYRSYELTESHRLWGAGGAWAERAGTKRARRE